MIFLALAINIASRFMFGYLIGMLLFKIDPTLAPVVIGLYIVNIITNKIILLKGETK